jgi:hypothetical protein
MYRYGICCLLSVVYHRRLLSIIVPTCTYLPTYSYQRINPPSLVQASAVKTGEDNPSQSSGACREGRYVPDQFHS